MFKIIKIRNIFQIAFVLCLAHMSVSAAFAGCTTNANSDVVCTDDASADPQPIQQQSAEDVAEEVNVIPSNNGPAPGFISPELFQALQSLDNASEEVVDDGDTAAETPVQEAVPENPAIAAIDDLSATLQNTFLGVVAQLDFSSPSTDDDVQTLANNFRVIGETVDNACGGRLPPEERVLLTNSLANLLAQQDTDVLLGDVQGIEAGTDVVREQNQQVLQSVVDDLLTLDLTIKPDGGGDLDAEIVQRNSNLLLGIVDDLEDFGLAGQDNETILNDLQSKLDGLELNGQDNADILGNVTEGVGGLDAGESDGADGDALSEAIEDLVALACRNSVADDEGDQDSADEQSSDDSSSSSSGGGGKSPLSKLTDQLKNLFGGGKNPLSNNPFSNNPFSNNNNSSTLGGPVGKGSAGMTCELHKAIEWGAGQMGMDPSTLAAIIQVETNNTGDPSICNGVGYCGLIQFGKPEAREVGSTQAKLIRMSPLEQMEYVKRFFVKRSEGVGRDVGSLTEEEAYATVHGGNPEADLNRKDKVNGKTTGNIYKQWVKPKVNNYRQNFDWTTKNWKPGVSEKLRKNNCSPSDPNAYEQNLKDKDLPIGQLPATIDNKNYEGNIKKKFGL